jgi:hypothetical protein
MRDETGLDFYLVNYMDLLAIEKCTCKQISQLSDNARLIDNRQSRNFSRNSRVLPWMIFQGTHHILKSHYPCFSYGLVSQSLLSCDGLLSCLVNCNLLPLPDPLLVFLNTIFCKFSSWRVRANTPSRQTRSDSPFDDNSYYTRHRHCRHSCRWHRPLSSFGSCSRRTFRIFRCRTRSR